MCIKVQDNSINFLEFDVRVTFLFDRLITDELDSALILPNSSEMFSFFFVFCKEMNGFEATQHILLAYLCVQTSFLPPTLMSCVSQHAQVSMEGSVEWNVSRTYSQRYLSEDLRSGPLSFSVAAECSDPQRKSQAAKISIQTKKPHGKSAPRNEQHNERRRDDE